MFIEAVDLDHIYSTILFEYFINPAPIRSPINPIKIAIFLYKSSKRVINDGKFPKLSNIVIFFIAIYQSITAEQNNL